MMIFVKIHRSIRKVVALCDSDLMGKRFEEGNRQLEIKESFFNGSEVSEGEAVKIIILQEKEDATFNIVGRKSVEAAKKASLISNRHIGFIRGIPFALVLD